MEPKPRKHGPTQRQLAAELRRRIAALPDVEMKPLPITGGIVPEAYWVAGAEFVHFHGDGQIDLRIPEESMREEILRDARAKVDPYARSRVEFDFAAAGDMEDAFRLICRVYQGFKSPG